MPRRPAYLKKSVKFEFERLHRKCCYCKTHQNTRGFDKHVAWCKKICTIRNELRDLQSLSAATEVQAEGTSSQIPSSLQVDSPAVNGFIEGSSSIPMEADYPPDLDLQETTTTSSINGMLSLSQTSPPDFYLEVSRTHFRVWTSFTTRIHQNYSTSPFSRSDNDNNSTEHWQHKFGMPSRVWHNLYASSRASPMGSISKSCRF